MPDMKMSRRTFIKTSGALAGIAAAGGTLACAGNAFTAGADEAAGEERIAWSQCNVNCGGNCVFQWHVRDGKVAYMETDNTGDDDFQVRACLRGRSMRRWLNHPDRLLYPMKRTGKRGEGKFERISWDEAIQTIHDKLEKIYKDYGPESVFVNYATGMYSSTGRNSSRRRLGLRGGFVNQGADYSTHMLQVVMPYMYGSAANLDENGLHATLKKPATAFSPYDNVNASSFSEAELHSDLLVMFGNSPAETRMGGANAVWAARSSTSTTA